MGTKFTPGPWRVEKTPYLHVRSDAGCVFASDYTTPANASLISAAPELYEALKEARDYITWLIASENDGPYSKRPSMACPKRKIDAALVKARGETT